MSSTLAPSITTAPHAATKTLGPAETVSVLFAGGPVEDLAYEASVISSDDDLTTYRVICTPTISEAACVIPTATVVQGSSTWAFESNNTAKDRADFYRSDCELIPEDDDSDCIVVHSYSNTATQVVRTFDTTGPFSWAYVTAVVTEKVVGRDEEDDNGELPGDDSEKEDGVPRSAHLNLVMGLIVVITAVLLW